MIKVIYIITIIGIASLAYSDNTELGDFYGYKDSAKPIFSTNSSSANNEGGKSYSGSRSTTQYSTIMSELSNNLTLYRESHTYENLDNLYKTILKYCQMNEYAFSQVKEYIKRHGGRNYGDEIADPEYESRKINEGLETAARKIMLIAFIRYDKYNANYNKYVEDYLSLLHRKYGFKYALVLSSNNDINNINSSVYGEARNTFIDNKGTYSNNCALPSWPSIMAYNPLSRKYSYIYIRIRSHDDASKEIINFFQETVFNKDNPFQILKTGLK